MPLPGIRVAVRPYICIAFSVLITALWPANAGGGAMLAQGVDAGWWQTAQAGIMRAEYEFARGEHDMAAPNRAQDLRVYLDTRGLRLTPRTTSNWTWSWRMENWGRDASATRLGPVDPQARGSHAEFTHGGLVEWYENSAEGLEQGFTLTRRPAGEGPLRISGLIGGDLQGELDEDGESIHFLDPHGAEVLRYGKLLAIDATGRTLPSRMHYVESRIALVVEDAGATYPLIIDPLLTTPDWTLNTAVAGAELGFTVATAGDINGDGYSDLIVGAPGYSFGSLTGGAVYAYLGGPGGVSGGYHARLVGGEEGARFGAAVSTAGDVNNDGYDDIVIGAPDYPTWVDGTGKVFVYTGSAEGLNTALFWAKESDRDSNFGFSVSWAGDVNGDGYDDIVAGMPNHSYGNVTGAGRVSVYSGAAYGLDLFWGYSGTADHAHFGWDVAGAGDIDCDGYDDIIFSGVDAVHQPGRRGAVRVYLGDTGSMVYNWDFMGAFDTANFGYAVAGLGDIDANGYADVLIGIPGMAGDTGSAYVYHGSSAGVAAGPAHLLSGEQNFSRFGEQVATAGDFNGDGYADAIVSAPHYDAGSGSEGRVYIYRGNHAGLDDEPYWSVTGEQAAGELGSGVATAGDIDGNGFSDILIGHARYDGSATDTGRAYLYLSDGYCFAVQYSHLKLYGEQTGAEFGCAVASAGDVDGDGFSDVLVGAPKYDHGQVDEGCAFLFRGGESGTSTSPWWFAQGDQEGAWLGRAVAGAGDVNGDGCADLLIGATAYDNYNVDEGAAFLWYGDAQGMAPGSPANAAWHDFGHQSACRYGHAVCGIGDVNADGFADIGVGAPGHRSDLTNEGAVFAYYGSAEGLPPSADWMHDSDREFVEFGFSVASAGDFNGDGFSDIIASAPWFSNGHAAEGAAFVYLGSADGFPNSTSWWHCEGQQESSKLGYSVASAGDVNGDGFSDVVVGAPSFSSAAGCTGIAFVFHGATSSPAMGTPTNAQWSGWHDQDYASFGHSVAGTGDVNGDGYGDIIVGAPSVSAVYGDDCGCVRLYMGSDSGVEAGAAWEAVGYQEGAKLGSAVTGAGDVNGDGFGDAVLGAPEHTFAYDHEGMAMVYLGNDRGGTSLVPRQWRSDFSHVLDHYGISGARDAVSLSARARMPGGRGHVRLACEVVPHGSPFTGSGVSYGSWCDTGEAREFGSWIGLGRTITGLAADTPYIWRLRIEADNPHFPRTRWIMLPGRSLTETKFRTAPPASAAQEWQSPGCFALRGAPDQTGRSVSLTYCLPTSGPVRLSIHDIEGRRVCNLIAGWASSGPQSATWSGSDAGGRRVATGVYFARLEAAGREETCRLVIAR